MCGKISFLHKVFETFENHRTSIDMMATSEVGVTLTIDDDSRRVEQAHGYVVQLGRQHAGRMQNLGAEICQLGGLASLCRQP